MLKNSLRKGEPEYHIISHPGIRKRIFTRLVLFSAMIIFRCEQVMACEACKQQQPKFLRGITHGPGPGGNLDYAIVGIMVIITLYSLYATIKCLINPAEKDNDHIKRIILNN